MPDQKSNQSGCPVPGANRGREDCNVVMSRRDLLRMAGASLMVGAAASGAAIPEPDPGESPGVPGNPAPGVTPGAAAIFPQPQQMEVAGASFLLDRDVTIVIPAQPTDADLFFSRFLTEELSDRFDLQLRTERVERLPPGRRVILLGSLENPLVHRACAERRLDLTAQKPGPEGYTLDVSEGVALVAGSDIRGAFYGLQSLRQLVTGSAGGLSIAGVRVRDWPAKPFRGIKLYLPGRSNIPYFKHFIRNFAALYKFNTLMVEMNACMRLDRHPELNAGWIEFARDTDWSRRNYPPGPLHGREQNSSHQDCGDGGFIEKSEVAALARISREHYIEFVPEIPSLTHSFYLLTRHKDLSEVPGDKWPDTYCSSNPATYRLLFDVMDEYIDVTAPKMAHTGHDEWFAPFGLCPRCKGKNPGELYGRDLRRIHDYLAGRKIRMAIWGDYLLESVRGKGLQRRTAPDGWVYHSPGAMTPEQVKALVPKDILIFNWFWSEREHGEMNEAQLADFGFQQVYGNLEPEFHRYRERSQRASILGGAPSSWAATTAFNMNKDMLYSILGCSSMLWSGSPMDRHPLCLETQSLMPQARCELSGVTPPSETGDPVLPLDISGSFNGHDKEFFSHLRGMAAGKVESGRKVFVLPGSGPGAMILAGTEGAEPSALPREVRGIRISKDITSLIFLHACARPATNKEAYRLIWDPRDSADLLGWYEIVYEDGLVERAPIRYGVNILEWNWKKSEASGKYCYDAGAVDCGVAGGTPVTLFAYEWINPRLGKIIAEVRLNGSIRFRGAVPGFENHFGEVIPGNAIMLKAISYVPKHGPGGR